MKNTHSNNIPSEARPNPKLLNKYGDIFSLNPGFVTGFVDGDGSFTVSIAKKKSGTG